jgi:ribosomal protein L32
MQGGAGNISVDVLGLDNIICKNCGFALYREAYILKRLPMLQSPTGKEEIVPVPVMVCMACGTPAGQEAAAKS